ncbi:MAG TPA: glycosyltransferase [Candidatus Acidoferrum sp.]|nr:glycosyltransferase [Candidatus Acidoferrum sp.]
MTIQVIAPLTIVLFSPGLRDEDIVWGERLIARSEQKSLEREFPGARVVTFDRGDLATLAGMDVDLLISSYTGPEPPWRVDDIASYVNGVTILKVVNHADRLDEFSRIPVDGFITNSRSAVTPLGRHRPAVYIPLAVDDDFGRVAPDPRYRADVVYLGSGGRGNKRPETTRRYLDGAKGFDFHLWGGCWDAAYWAPAYRDDPRANTWHRYWRGLLPLDDIAALYSSAKIVLGYHEESQRAWGMWNNRVFEALACGAFFICDDAQGLREEFGEGVEITGGGDQTARLITYYLARGEERRQRGEAGRRIVREKYTYGRWARRVREFYEQLRARRPRAVRSARGR